MGSRASVSEAGTAQTLFAPASGSATIAAPDAMATRDSDGEIGDDRPSRARSGGTVTVLPDVVTEGGRLVIIARDQARYEADKVLGRGGMGEVKLARDHDIGRRVAVKRMLDEQPQAVARFVDEIRTVGALEHPNIVPIHDVGVDEEGKLFFVMKYVEGETLADIIARLHRGDPGAQAEYTFERRLDIFASLLRALHYAHAQGLVHRDIKPENIMVGRYGEVVLMDWGIAHRIRADDHLAAAADQVLGERAAAETVDGALVGTCQYMSPEQAAGEVADLDGRSDLYCAFVLLFELLTLRPYIAEGKTAAETLLRVQDRERPLWNAPEFDHPHQASIPMELRHFLWHGLAKAKDERFPDAGAVAAELERLRAGEFKVECLVTFMKHNNGRMGRFMDNYPVLSTTTALLTPLVFVAGAAGWVMWALS